MHDPRITPVRPDLAAEFLRGVVDAPRFAAGRVLRVAIGVAPVRGAPRPDAPLLTEALLGETVAVFDTQEGWCWGQLEADGYVGWLPEAAFEGDQGEPTHRVSALRSFRFPGPSIKLPPADVVPLNARVTVVGRNGTLAVLAGGGCVPDVHLCPLDRFDSDFVAVAERFAGVPYLWGGKTGLGLDCSGLVQVALMACGQVCPRDSDMQEASLGAAVTDWDAATLRRGDLIFWQGHVAIARGDGTIIHANAHHMAVAIEPAGQAIVRIAAAGFPVRAIRRPA